jgi:hypothetical protein
MKPSIFLLLACLCAPLGCASADTEDLQVSPSILNPSLNIKAVALGSTYDGSFTLVLALGINAAKPSPVTIETFSLVSASDGRSLISPLPLPATSVKNTTIEPNKSQQIVYNLASGQVIEAAKVTELCQAKQVVIRGSIFDGVKNRSTPVESAAFTVTGCP